MDNVWITCVGRRTPDARQKSFVHAGTLTQITPLPHTVWRPTRARRRVSQNDRAYNEVMPKDAAELLREALSLPAEARAALVDTLLESLDVEVDENAAEAWRAEIYRRLLEIDTGAVTLIPWDDAQRRLWARLQG